MAHSMEKRFCSSCKQITWHNAGKVEGASVRYRCTYCGHPVTTNQEGKRIAQQGIQKAQVDKLELRRKLGLV